VGLRSGRLAAALVLGAVCVSLSVVTVNIAFLNVGLPSLARQLGATNTGLEWIVDSYALVFAGLLLAAGSMGDRIGRKRTLLIGLGVFGAGSVAASLVHTTAALIAARCVMGAGAACVMPMTLSILTAIYTTEHTLRRALGVWAATASAASVAAPLAAGALLAHFWWGSLFLVNVPFCLAAMAAVAWVVPAGEVDRREAIDWLGILLSIAFSSALVVSLIEGPDRGWASPFVVTGLVISALTAVGFCRWELKVAHPLIDVRFFRLPRFSTGCLVVALQYFFTFGTSFVVTQYLQLVLGYSALKAGAALMPSAALLMVVAPVGARAFGRLGARAVAPAALGVMALSGTALMAIGGGRSFWTVFAAMMLSSLAVGMMAAGTTSMVMSALPPDRAGMASGAQSTTRQLGGALGIAVIGSLLAARYTATLTRDLSGTAGAPFLSTARRSLAAALNLPHATAPVRELVARLARSAFVGGINLTGAAVAVLAAVSAVLVFVVLPSREPEPSLAALPTPLPDDRFVPGPAIAESPAPPAPT
jgi:EmrB/QacA subfamily drug resistance transporter